MGRRRIEFPDELLEEIVIRLPIQSIIAARSVCSRWRNKLCAKYFQAKKDSREPQQRWIIMDFFLLSEGFLGVFDTIDKKWLKIPLSLPPNTRFSLLCGSCGYLCFMDRQAITTHHIHLCNPVTQQWLQLPLPRSIKTSRLHIRMYGIRGSNHFKLLMIDGTDLPSRLASSLYDSQTGDWKPRSQEWITNFTSLWDNLAMCKDGIYDMDKEEWRLRGQISDFQPTTLRLRRDGSVFRTKLVGTRIRVYQLDMESTREELVTESPERMRVEMPPGCSGMIPWSYFDGLDNLWVVCPVLPAIYRYEPCSGQWSSFDNKWSGAADFGYAICCELSFHEFPDCTTPLQE
ncbi:hypothetical protein SELMODRAFT_413910 [Selaginella moellendorffii]|uniref:F-box domain-containing protein n=1 Tax=Selaginella moellendorffii TaxID=88036 RepID=D8RR09_SELML|nr:uncharacterized protein LOC9642435 [Selaginella moellendorffii]EFJ25162.1 hypothetical protein SELMODRAFT_413910 [Selaginella moellendorffii]|eukprot:XP_002973502.1 uncharacterized protein LOC9642435 [Selaginella moellendorffii]